MKISIFKFLISFIIFLVGLQAYAQITYASLTPISTRIIYDLNAEKNLIGVSYSCQQLGYGKDKTLIGDTFHVNAEQLVKLKPNYIFALQSAKPKLSEIRLTKTKPIYFEFSSIEDIYAGIRLIAKYTEKNENAEPLIQNIKNKIDEYKTKNPKRILYIVQNDPLITIGNKSFINDIIIESGHYSVTSELDYSYPAITLEYAIKSNPDVVIITFGGASKKFKKLFPNSEILYLSSMQRDIINSPNSRVFEAVKLFSTLNFSTEPQN